MGYPASPYLLGFLPDLLLVGGGASLALFLLFKLLVLGHLATGERTPLIWNAGIWLSFAVNYPHFAATFYRLYRSAESRDQYPRTTWLSPLVVLAAVVVAGRDPEGAGSCLAKLFLWWNGWHYAGQAMGVAMIYVRKAGVRVGWWQKWALAAPGFAAWLLGMTWLEAGPRYSFYALPVVPFQWDSDVIAAAWILLYVSAAVSLATYARLSYQRRAPLPILVLAPIALQVFWTTPGAGFRAFAEFIPLFHGIQYLTITAVFHLREEGLEGAPASDVTVGLGAYWLKIMLLGATGFWLLPKLLERFFAIPEPLGKALCIIAINIHHFFIDGVIWKLRSKPVADRLAIQSVPAL